MIRQFRRKLTCTTLHHTQITLKSDVNDGTAFSFSLPDGTEK